MNANNPIKGFESKLRTIKKDTKLLTKYQKHLLFKEILYSFDLLSMMYHSNALSNKRIITECRLLTQQLGKVEAFFQTLVQKREIIENLKEQVSVYTTSHNNGTPKRIDDLIYQAETKLRKMENEQFYPDESRFFYHLDFLIGLIQEQFGELIKIFLKEEKSRREKKSKPNITSERTDEIIRITIPVLANLIDEKWKKQGRELSRDIDMILERSDLKVQISLCNERGNKLTNRLKRLKAFRETNPNDDLVLIYHIEKESAFTLIQRGCLEDLRNMPRTRIISPDNELLAVLNTFRVIFDNARTDDLLNNREVVRAWLKKQLSKSALDFLDNIISFSGITSQADILKNHKKYWSKFWSEKEKTDSPHPSSLKKGKPVPDFEEIYKELKERLNTGLGDCCLHYNNLIRDIPENVIINMEKVPINKDILFTSEEMAIFRQYL